MRLAFVSCFHARLYRHKPMWAVWDEIAALQPDVLVLLGDSIYLDVSSGHHMDSLQAALPNEFAIHAHKLYKELLAAPKFKELVSRPSLRVHAIWDDHDFLWNDACGADVYQNKALRPTVHASRAQFAAFRAALAANLAPGSFPAQPVPWEPAPPPPGYSCVPLAHNTLLHLTDGRSFKKGGGKRAVMGMAQIDSIEQAMQAAPAGAVHLVTTGVVFESRKGESWLDCKPEFERMQALGRQHNILVLSGDIHDNNLAAIDLGNGRFMYEATSSGAALKTRVVIGSELRNFGMLDIGDDTVHVRIRKTGALQYTADLDRATWRPA